MGKIKLLDIGSANPRLDAGWSKLSNVQIVMFEPDERSYKEIVKGHNKESEHRVYNYALDAIDRDRKLFLTSKPELTSFYRPRSSYHNLFPNSQRWKVLDEIIVSCKSIKSIYSELGDYDFIKIDTQGSELDILQGAVGGGLDQALGVESEVEFIELYEGQPLFGEVCKFMTQNDFEFFDFVVQYRYGRKNLNRKGQLAFADALFLRTPEYIKNEYQSSYLSIDKVVKYIQICSVYQKFDLIKVISDYFDDNEIITAEVERLLRNEI